MAGPTRKVGSIATPRPAAAPARIAGPLSALNRPSGRTVTTRLPSWNRQTSPPVVTAGRPSRSSGRAGTPWASRKAGLATVAARIGAILRATRLESSSAPIRTAAS